MKYFLLPVLFILASCSSSGGINKDFVPSTQKGLAVGTVTFEGDIPVNDIYRFFYQPVTTDKKEKRKHSGKIEIKARKDNQSAFNGDFNNAKTYLFIIEAEPGKYEFNQYNYLDHIGYTGMVYTSKEFSIPFEIKKGEITYIGELAYRDAARPGETRIYVSGYFERDINEFKNKYPFIKWEKAKNETIKEGNTGGGIVDFR
jgi:hypothetical protein